ncbi:MAG TPA: hypothetical protein VNG51_16890 [Ktedonobacteraceae bacterium]|nr:hypothetical protein [Ktedonobacteraceae bacterium]
MDEEEGVSPAEKKKRENAARQKAYRERRAQEAKAAEPEPVIEEEEPELKVDTKNVPPKAKPSLAERLGFGKKSADTPIKKAASHHKKAPAGPNLVVTLLPTIIASLVAAYCRDRLAPEYQACAPTNDEVVNVVKPLMAILGRRVSVAARVSQDAIDLTNALICAMAYSTRAYITYVNIKKAREADARALYKLQVDGQDTGAGTVPPVHRVSTEGPESYSASSNGTSHGDDPQSIRDYEAGLVADLLRRDKQGRDQRGLN